MLSNNDKTGKREVTKTIHPYQKDNITQDKV
jgi:hypothetical protein